MNASLSALLTLGRQLAERLRGRPALQASDDDPQARDAMRRAGEARRAGRLDEARTLYRYVLQRWPHHAEALRTLRDLAIDERNWDEAIALQERLLEIAPPADRPAESSWLAQASAAMLSAGPRVSTALVLRTLAAGCPLIWVAPGGRSSGVARWLAEQECARVVPAEPSAITQALSDMLDRDSEVERMIERGKALAASHGPRRLSDRLAAVIATSPPKRRAA